MSVNRRFFVGAAGASLLAPARAAGAPTREAYLAAAAYSAERRGVSLLVMADGEVLFEDYPDGQADAAHQLASGTKSFCGVLAAAAVADRLLSLDEACVQTLPEWRGDDRRAVTIRQLLNLTSGLAASGVARPKTYAEAVETKLASAPGARFAYGSDPFQIFGEILKRKLAASGRPADILAYLKDRILTPIGAAEGGWRRDAAGDPWLAAGAAFAARDWARFGQFVLDGGRDLDGATLSACFDGTRANPGYGLSWWLMRPGLIPPGPRAGLEGGVSPALANEDVAMAAGAGNQRLYLLRQRRLVVVRQADGILQALRGRGARWSDETFLSTLLA